jgi:signal transduction histidine kinase
MRALKRRWTKPPSADSKPFAFFGPEGCHLFMATKKTKTTSGGRNAQKGFIYQNSIAASHLFELLIGADRVWRVTTETLSPVDDILVERRDAKSSYYQVKCYQGVSEWTFNRLMAYGVLEQFRTQYNNSGNESRLILSSPVPTGCVHDCAEEARRCSSPQQFGVAFLTDKQRKIFTNLANFLGSDVLAYYFLRSYYEEPWPPAPEQIQEICLGRYRNSPYASIAGIWAHLCDIVALEAVRGRPLKRPDLLDVLYQRLALGDAVGLKDTDINLIRHTAKEAWYVHRDEEFDLLSAMWDLSNRVPRNLLVIGDGGTGKSSFFAWMCREFEKHSRLTVLAVAAEGGDLLELIDRITEGLKASLSNIEPRGGTVCSRIDRLVWYVRQAQAANRFVVIAVDHFESFFSSIFVNQSRDKMAQARFSVFEAISRTCESKALMWVLFARSEYFFLMFPNQDSLQALNLSWIQLQDFSEEQAQQLLSKLISIADVEFSEDARRLFLNNSPRNPLKLNLAFLKLSNAYPDSITGKQVLRLQPWEDIFKEDFDSLDDIEADVVYAIASLTISKARRTFTFEEIETSLHGAQRRQRSADELRDILHRIQDARHLLQQPVTGRYALYHEAFASYVISRYGGRVITPESLRQYEDFMLMFLHQTKVPLHALLASIRHLTDLEMRADEAQNTPKRRLESLQRLDDAVHRYITQFRSAELFALRSQRRTQDMMAREPLSLRDVLLETIHRIQRMTGGSSSSDVRLELPRVGMTIRGDEEMLSLALSNVIENAIKHSVKDSPIFVRARDEDRLYVVEVSNVSVGLKREELRMFFELGYRGSNAERSVAGTGVGLYVTKCVAEAHGGSVHLESKPLVDSDGTTTHLVSFVLQLPKAFH